MAIYPGKLLFTLFIKGAHKESGSENAQTNCFYVMTSRKKILRQRREYYIEVFGSPLLPQFI
jgi:hypothetical protein